MSTLVQKRFLQLEEFKDAGRIALYTSFKNEVLTEDIWNAAIEEGKEVFFPRVVNKKKGLVFVKADNKEGFSRGTYNISEPGDGVVLDELSTFELVVVPGIAFDMNGNRLGYGEGFYDMVLKTAKCCILATAFDFQIVEAIEAEPHDMEVHKIITESRTIITECSCV
jgi:5-formyltetrahydrofolate cyclo-ligase